MNIVKCKKCHNEIDYRVKVCAKCYGNPHKPAKKKEPLVDRVAKCLLESGCRGKF